MLAFILSLLLLPGFRGQQLDRAEIRALVAEHPGWPVERMTDVFLCESLGYESAVSPTHDAGLTQINAIHWRGARDVYRLLTDARYNVARAHEVWQQQGIRAWVCAW